MHSMAAQGASNSNGGALHLPTAHISSQFTLRGYVAAVREVDFTKCWPFSLKSLQDILDEGKKPFLPPLYLSGSSNHKTSNSHVKHFREVAISILDKGKKQQSLDLETVRSKSIDRQNQAEILDLQCKDQSELAHENNSNVLSRKLNHRKLENRDQCDMVCDNAGCLHDGKRRVESAQRQQGTDKNQTAENFCDNVDQKCRQGCGSSSNIAEETFQMQNIPIGTERENGSFRGSNSISLNHSSAQKDSDGERSQDKDKGESVCGPMSSNQIGWSEGSLKMKCCHLANVLEHKAEQEMDCHLLENYGRCMSLDRKIRECGNAGQEKASSGSTTSNENEACNTGCMSDRQILGVKCRSGCEPNEQKAAGGMDYSAKDAHVQENIFPDDRGDKLSGYMLGLKKDGVLENVATLSEDLVSIRTCPICQFFKSSCSAELNAHIDHCLKLAAKGKSQCKLMFKRKKRSIAEICSLATHRVRKKFPKTVVQMRYHLKRLLTYQKLKPQKASPAEEKHLVHVSKGEDDDNCRLSKKHAELKRKRKRERLGSAMPETGNASPEMNTLSSNKKMKLDFEGHRNRPANRCFYTCCKPFRGKGGWFLINNNPPSQNKSFANPLKSVSKNTTSVSPESITMEMESVPSGLKDVCESSANTRHLPQENHATSFLSMAESQNFDETLILSEKASTSTEKYEFSDVCNESLNSEFGNASSEKALSKEALIQGQRMNTSTKLNLVDDMQPLQLPYPKTASVNCLGLQPGIPKYGTTHCNTDIEDPSMIMSKQQKPENNQFLSGTTANDLPVEILPETKSKELHVMQSQHAVPPPVMKYNSAQTQQDIEAIQHHQVPNQNSLPNTSIAALLSANLSQNCADLNASNMDRLATTSLNQEETAAAEHLTREEKHDLQIRVSPKLCAPSTKMVQEEMQHSAAIPNQTYQTSSFQGQIPDVSKNIDMQTKQHAINLEEQMNLVIQDSSKDPNNERSIYDQNQNTSSKNLTISNEPERNIYDQNQNAPSSKNPTTCSKLAKVNSFGKQVLRLMGKTVVMAPGYNQERCGINLNSIAKPNLEPENQNQKAFIQATQDQSLSVNGESRMSNINSVGLSWQDCNKLQQEACSRFDAHKTTQRSDCQCILIDCKSKKGEKKHHKRALSPNAQHNRSCRIKYQPTRINSASQLCSENLHEAIAVGTSASLREGNIAKTLHTAEQSPCQEPSSLYSELSLSKDARSSPAFIINKSMLPVISSKNSPDLIQNKDSSVFDIPVSAQSETAAHPSANFQRNCCKNIVTLPEFESYSSTIPNVRDGNQITQLQKKSANHNSHVPSNCFSMQSRYVSRQSISAEKNVPSQNHALQGQFKSSQDKSIIVIDDDEDEPLRKNDCNGMDPSVTDPCMLHHSTSNYPCAMDPSSKHCTLQETAFTPASASRISTGLEANEELASNSAVMFSDEVPNVKSQCCTRSAMINPALKTGSIRPTVRNSLHTLNPLLSCSTSHTSSEPQHRDLKTNQEYTKGHVSQLFNNVKKTGVDQPKDVLLYRSILCKNPEKFIGTGHRLKPDSKGIYSHVSFSQQKGIERDGSIPKQELSLQTTREQLKGSKNQWLPSGCLTFNAPNADVAQLQACMHATGVPSQSVSLNHERNFAGASFGTYNTNMNSIASRPGNRDSSQLTCCSSHAPLKINSESYLGTLSQKMASGACPGSADPRQSIAEKVKSISAANPVKFDVGTSFNPLGGHKCPMHKDEFKEQHERSKLLYQTQKPFSDQVFIYPASGCATGRSLYVQNSKKQGNEAAASASLPLPICHPRPLFLQSSSDMRSVKLDRQGRKIVLSSNNSSPGDYFTDLRQNRNVHVQSSKSMDCGENSVTLQPPCLMKQHHEKAPENCLPREDSDPVDGKAMASTSKAPSQTKRSPMCSNNLPITENKSNANLKQGLPPLLYYEVVSQPSLSRRLHASQRMAQPIPPYHTEKSFEGRPIYHRLSSPSGTPVLCHRMTRMDPFCGGGNLQDGGAQIVNPVSSTVLARPEHEGTLKTSSTIHQPHLLNMRGNSFHTPVITGQVATKMSDGSLVENEACTAKSKTVRQHIPQTVKPSSETLSPEIFDIN